jgi:hypothetical protein
MMLDHKIDHMNNLRAVAAVSLQSVVSNLAQATTEVSGKSETKLHCTGAP